VLEKLMDISVLRNENERLKEQLARTQAALAESEEARQRLETIVVDMRREKFGAKSEKLRPDQFHLPLEDVEIAQGVLDAAHQPGCDPNRSLSASSNRLRLVISAISLSPRNTANFSPMGRPRDFSCASLITGSSDALTR
jgi:hypothetical protein